MSENSLAGSDLWKQPCRRVRDELSVHALFGEVIEIELGVLGLTRLPIRSHNDPLPQIEPYAA